LPGRRNYLFKSSRARLFGEPIPPAMPAKVALEFRQIETSGPAGGQFVCIANPNEFAVDLTGWRLSGGGIEHSFRPGTVIPAGKEIYAVGDAKSFRNRSTPPSGGQSLLVQGNWKGQLQIDGGALQLADASGRVVCRGRGGP
jgi:hypothetical protein